jgi:hypothetical protein
MCPILYVRAAINVRIDEGLTVDPKREGTILEGSAGSPTRRENRVELCQPVAAG